MRTAGGFLHWPAPRRTVTGERRLLRPPLPWPAFARRSGLRPRGAKKGADRGIDGVRYFQDEQKGGAWVTKTMLVQVKGGKAGVSHVPDLVGTMTREGPEMGVFISLQPPTKAMQQEAAAAGTYRSPWDNQDYPKVQVLTVEELLQDPHHPDPACLAVPRGGNVTFTQAHKHRRKRVKQHGLGLEGDRFAGKR